MNKNFRVVPSLFLSLMMFTVSAVAGNVLSNPDFESDPGGQSQNLYGWNWYGPNTFNETGSDAQNGTNFFKVYQAFTTSVNYNGIYQDYISGAGATYSADGWAKTLASDQIAGQNVAWIEVSFRDANANIIALYRSSIISTNAILAGAFPTSAWAHLFVTNQYDPNSYNITNTTSTLVAPPGTYFVRYQIVFQGDALKSGGSVYFDNLSLNFSGLAAYGNWNVVWDDEFNGTTINTNTWTNDIGGGGWGNSEMEYYTSRTNNAYVAGGLLHIVAQQESYGGQSYTSARLKTQGLVSWLYGRFEWRARLPAGTGFWPALWFLGTNITSVNWPGCGEIDVTEDNGASNNFVQGSLHSGSDETAKYTFLDGDSVTNFHTYVLDWSTNSFIWYVDGHLYEMQTSWGNTLGHAYPAPFNLPSFMIMNLAVGGSYVGYPPASAINTNGGFPGEMQVDYVRVYNPTPPLALAYTNTNHGFFISWNSNVVGHIQAQFSPAGLNSTNWADLTNSSTNPSQVSVTNGNAFFRLKSP